MKKIMSSALMLAILIAAVSCKSSKKNPNTNVVEEVKLSDAAVQTEPVEVTYADPKQQKAHEANMAKEEAPVVEKEKIISYPLSVSFFSIGTGTDGPMMQRFKDFITKYNKEYNVELVYELNNWGREGEVDFCFQLTELSSNQQAEFIGKSQKLLAESKLVHVAENAQCHPKRR